MEECLKSLYSYDCLRLEDLHSAYKSFLAKELMQDDRLSHINSFMDMENRIGDIPSIFAVGPLQLSSKPAKSSLKALAVSWKIEFSALMHTNAKVRIKGIHNMECTPLISVDVVVCTGCMKVANFMHEGLNRQTAHVPSSGAVVVAASVAVLLLL